MLSERKRVAIYCSDVAGAFDRVSSVLLMHALASKGLHSKILKVIDSWLQPRCAFVIVGSSKSHQLLLSNMVFQGTVLGPPLWNVFFESSRNAVNKCGFEEVVFADDLNCYRAYHPTCSNVVVRKGLKECQNALHDWVLLIK